MTALKLQTALSLLASATGLAGSLVLAFSLDEPLKFLRTHIELLDETVQQLIGRGNVLVFTGFETHHQREFMGSARRVRTGAGLLMIAFLAQGGSTVIGMCNAM